MRASDPVRLKGTFRRLSRSDLATTGSDAARQTGGELRRPRGDIDFEDRADHAYNAFRSRDDELPAVAGTARGFSFSAEDIAKIKKGTDRAR